MSKYQVKELIPAKEKNKIVDKALQKVNIPKHLPLPPFRSLYIAPSFSGKTLAIGNLLTNEHLGYKELFGKNVFIFSPTITLNDPSLYGVDIPEENIYDDYSEEIIQEIIDEQSEIIKEFKKEKAPHCLLILDDIITSIPDTKKDILKKLFFSARHYKISLIVTSQQFNQVSRGIRLNASNIFVFTVNNSEVKRIGEEQAIDFDLWKEIYEESTLEPYSFLHINMKAPIKERYLLRYEPLQFSWN